MRTVIRVGRIAFRILFTVIFDRVSTNLFLFSHHLSFPTFLQPIYQSTCDCQPMFGIFETYGSKANYLLEIIKCYIRICNVPTWILATEVDCWSQMEVTGRLSFLSYSPCLKNSSQTFILHFWDMSQGLVGLEMSAHFSAI